MYLFPDKTSHVIKQEPFFQRAAAFKCMLALWRPLPESWYLYDTQVVLDCFKEEEPLLSLHNCNTTFLIHFCRMDSDK